MLPRIAQEVPGGLGHHRREALARPWPRQQRQLRGLREGLMSCLSQTRCGGFVMLSAARLSVRDVSCVRVELE